MPTQLSCPSSACKLMFRIKMCYRGHYSSLALSSLCLELLCAHLITGWTDEAACVEPIIVHQLHLDLLTRVEASKGVVEDLHMKPLILADVVVAPGSPVLPLPHLAAAPLFPHTLCVVKTFGADSIGLKSKISIITWKKYLS